MNNFKKGDLVIVRPIGANRLSYSGSRAVITQEHLTHPTIKLLTIVKGALAKVGDERFLDYRWLELDKQTIVNRILEEL